MSIGEIISALAICASSSDEDKDCLLMERTVYSLEVDDEDDSIVVHFVDANTPDVRIYKDGIRVLL